MDFLRVLCRPQSGPQGSLRQASGPVESLGRNYLAVVPVRPDNDHAPILGQEQWTPHLNIGIGVG